MRKRRSTRRKKRKNRIHKWAGADVSLRFYFRERVAAGVVKKKEEAGRRERKITLTP
jgi:hypothetical protein